MDCQLGFKRILKYPRLSSWRKKLEISFKIITDGIPKTLNKEMEKLILWVRSYNRLYTDCLEISNFNTTQTQALTSDLYNSTIPQDSRNNSNVEDTTGMIIVPQQRSQETRTLGRI